MKKGIGLALLCMLLLFNVWSKGNGDAGSDRKVPMATFLGGNETVSEVVEELKNAGLSNTDVFQNRVLDYAATAGRNAGLEDGWVLPSELTVDTAKCMDGWESTHDYSDANCRMTAFLLLEGLITAERVEETYTGTYLMFDMEAIDATEKYERIKENRALFTTLFGDKTVPEGKEPQNIYSEAWEDFGLKVHSNQVSMLSLVIYDPYFQTTFVGHTGVLLNCGDHMDSFLSAMTREGYPEKSIQMFRNPILCLIQFCKDRGRQELDSATVEEFISYHAVRCANGEISNGTLDYYRRPARNFLNHIVTGMIHPVRKMTPMHSSLFESVIDAIRTDDIFNTPDRAHMVSAANIFFSWLEENDCFSPDNITLDHIRGFMLNRSNSVTGQTLSSDQRRLKLLNSYMISKGLMSKDFSSYLSLPIAIEKKILPAMPLDDIYQLLQSIDRNTAQGKKDYAIILLAAVTGLRAIDIVKLERSDIDWKTGELRISQSKTDEPLALPLTNDVGGAIKAYILDARPQSDVPNVFVHHRAPYAAYTCGSIISGRFNTLCRRAGIECKGFHSLRRSVGQRMTIAEIPLMTTSQILGHSGIDVTKQYISLDSKHLSICALSFDGVRPGGGIYA